MHGPGNPQCYSTNYGTEGKAASMNVSWDRKTDAGNRFGYDVPTAPANKCKDKGWAIVLITLMLATIGMGIYGATKINWTAANAGATDLGWTMNTGARFISLQVAFAVLGGIVFAYAWTFLIRLCAGFMIKACMFASLGLTLCIAFGVGGLTYYGSGSGWVPMLIGLVFFAIQAIYFYCIRHRIPFSEVMLTISTKRLHHYYGITLVALGFSILAAAWVLVGCLAVFGMSILQTGEADYGAEAPNMGLFAPMFFVVMWGAITMSYIVHTVCAGTMATWYFGVSRKRTVTDSLTRACTTSLGSLSFAAAVVAAIRTLEMMARSARNSSDNNVGRILACLAECILSCLGDIIDYLNHWACVRVAIYGEAYCTAAKRTWQMFKARGWDAIINDDISNLPVSTGLFVVLLLGIGLNYLTFDFAYHAAGMGSPATRFGTDVGTMKLLASAGFGVLGVMVAAQILCCISSFVQALYVCYADDPATFQQVHPEDCAKLEEAARKKNFTPPSYNGV